MAYLSRNMKRYMNCKTVQHMFGFDTKLYLLKIIFNIILVL